MHDAGCTIVQVCTEGNNVTRGSNDNQSNDVFGLVASSASVYWHSNYQVPGTGTGIYM
jgi:hypothetical protein